MCIKPIVRHYRNVDTVVVTQVKMDKIKGDKSWLSPELPKKVVPPSWEGFLAKNLITRPLSQKVVASVQESAVLQRSRKRMLPKNGKSSD